MSSTDSFMLEELRIRNRYYGAASSTFSWKYPLRMYTLIVIRPYHPYRASLLRRSHKTFCSKKIDSWTLETGNQTIDRDLSRSYYYIDSTSIQNSGIHIIDTFIWFTLPSFHDFTPLLDSWTRLCMLHGDSVSMAILSLNALLKHAPPLSPGARLGEWWR